MCLYISKTVNNIYRLRYIRDCVRVSISTRCCLFTVSMEMNRLVCNESNSESNSIISVSILAIAFTLTQSHKSAVIMSRYSWQNSRAFLLPASNLLAKSISVCESTVCIGGEIDQTPTQLRQRLSPMVLDQNGKYLFLLRQSLSLVNYCPSNRVFAKVNRDNDIIKFRHQ